MSLPLPTLLQREGRQVLAIPLAARRNEYVLRMLPDLRSAPGYRVEAGRIEEWRLEGFFSDEGRLYLYGPGEPGRLLETVIGDETGRGADPERGGEAALPFLARLAQALVHLEEAGIVLERLQSDSVVFLESGGVLFLPPEVMKKVGDLHPIAYKMRVFELINHPDRLGAPGRGRSSAHLSFSLGALTYRAVLGAYPFEADSEEELHNMMRHLQSVSPALRRPGLRSEVGRFLQQAMAQETGGAALAEWPPALAEWRREGLWRPLEEAEHKQLAEQARTQSERAARSYGRRVFWQRKGVTVLIVAATVVIAGVLAGSYVRNLLAPPATRGFAPREVVEAYLLSMNSLDHTLMEDCTVDGAGKQTIREVINLYVLSRVSQGYEGRSNILPADEWDRQGRPPLQPPETVFGVTDLEITPIRGEPEPVFDALYTRWIPEPVQEDPPGAAPAEPGDRGQTPEVGEPIEPAQPRGPNVAESRVSERYFLRMHRGAWAIYRIEPR